MVKKAKSFLEDMCGCQGAEDNDTISGGNGEGVPPVPIPNTEVKPFSAESTWLDTAREDRSPPDSMSISIEMLFFVPPYPFLCYNGRNFPRLGVITS